METTLVEATHAMETNLEDDIRHENKLVRRHMPWKQICKATHAVSTSLGNTRQKTTWKRYKPWKPNLEGHIRQEATLEATHVLKTNSAGDKRCEH